ncbi:MAG: 6-carboxytetrahydropterin synthase [Elusimicrobiaceae bacterium]|nr:6-carboxytetrahydropterin synthase [Elusimicrobiaceae bacterium]MBP5616201.1 6-carboxytetrahydropterin synthase [Elusimicrobiaceae bacterium]
MTQVYLTQCGSFTASHGHDGTLAEEAHTHTFTYEVTFHGPLNPEGYLVDFRLLQDFLHHHIDTPLNNANLNTLFKNPTTEALAVWIFQTVEKLFPQLCSVKVAEAPDRWVTYKGEK